MRRRRACMHGATRAAAKRLNDSYCMAEFGTIWMGSESLQSEMVITILVAPARADTDESHGVE